MWSTKYYIPFKSVNENQYRIDIEQNSMTVFTTDYYSIFYR